MKHRINWNFVRNKDEGYSLRWKYYPGRVNYKAYQYSPNTPIDKLKMISVFERYRNVGNKENFFINFIKYCSKNQINPFEYIPFTIILNKSFIYEKSLKNLEEINNKIDKKYNNLNNEKIQYTKLFPLSRLTGFSYKDFEKGNVLAVKNIVQAANRTRTIQTFVHVSSLAASGYAKSAKRPRLEAHAPLPVSDYGRTKLEGEKAVRQLNQHIKRTIIRPPIVYGKNDSGVSKIASWVKRGLMINTSGNGLFSFVYVGDLVEALWQAYKRPDTRNGLYFVSEEKTYSWNYFITQMAHAMHVQKPFMPKAPIWLMRVAAFGYESVARLTGIQPALNYDKVAEAVIPGHWICSSQKWRTLTGQKFTPLKQGLEQSF